MAIEVGHILDKYELIEKVGQGGMAVVYRGVDRSLHRQVAIKVLHHHLADNPEARDRFAREARAVARLRHDNILEIFDFSGQESDASYIVTEFIEGQTLKELITEHALGLPEIGAMLMVDVCRALSHAHSLGVLHRDVKPENIMIRTDGVVKLMDFGISQMLDLQRLTVTGQLLGSPAYMAPEHLSGDPLDFRTDVFAVGIVLYQLTVGALPFQGSNPHELLKRISECVYRDPRKENPLIGKTLGSIIDRALARRPDDRFPDIDEMRRALESYLCDECGLDDLRHETLAFLADPDSYEVALRQRLVSYLCAGGCELTDKQPVAALEFFNRALTIDPTQPEVLAAIDRMSRKRRHTRLFMAFGASLALALAGLMLVLYGLGAGKGGSQDQGQNPGQNNAWLTLAALLGDAGVVVPDTQPRFTAGQDAGLALVGSDADALGMVPGATADGAPDAMADPRDDTPNKRPVRPRDHDRGETPDAGIGATIGGPRRFALQVTQRRSQYRIDRGPWLPMGTHIDIELPPGAHIIEIKNPCCQTEQRQVRADESGGPLIVNLAYLPAYIRPLCPRAPGDQAVEVQINGQTVSLGNEHPVVVGGSLGTQDVRVTFMGPYKDVQTVTVGYNDHKEITCRFD